MFQSLFAKAALLVLLGTVAFAWWKGGPAERTGSVVNAVASLSVVVFQALTHESFHTLPILVADGLLAVGFLILAIRYASLWLGVAMMLQAMVFSLHAALLTGVVEAGYVYYLIMNLTSVAVMLTILIGTVGAWLRQRKAAKAA